MDKRRKLNLRRSTRCTNQVGSKLKECPDGGKKNSHSEYRDHSVRWDLQSTHILNELGKLYRLEEDESTDVTLFGTDGGCVRAHKIVLMLCSPFFQKLFHQVRKSQNNSRDGDAIVILGNLKTVEIQNLIHFMYTGRVNFSSNRALQEFHKVARQFGIDGVVSSRNYTDAGTTVAITPSTTSNTAVKRGRPPSSTVVNIKLLGEQPSLKSVVSYSDVDQSHLLSGSEGDGDDDNGTNSDGKEKSQIDEIGGRNKNLGKSSNSISTEVKATEEVTCKIEPSEQDVHDSLDEDFNYQGNDDTGSNFSDDLGNDDVLAEEDDDDDKVKDPDVSFDKHSDKIQRKCVSKSAKRLTAVADGGPHLSWRTGKLTGWTKIGPLPEEVLRKDWRKLNYIQCASNVTKVYYCPYGGKRKCPAILKIKTLVDGTELYFKNAYEHANHRGPDDCFGLTPEQKKFVMQCLEAGITQPKNILFKFEDSGVPPPQKLKLNNLLQRIKKKVGGKYWTKKEPKWPRRIRKKPVKEGPPPRKVGRPSKEELAVVTKSSLTTHSRDPAKTCLQTEQQTLPAAKSLRAESTSSLPTPSLPSTSSATFQSPGNLEHVTLAFPFNLGIVQHPPTAPPHYPFDNFR